MKGILKKTAGTGSWYWTITFPDGKDFESDDGSIFLRDCANLSTGASSLLVCKEDSDKLTNKDYDSVVDFEIVEGFFHDTNTKFREAKIK